MVGTPVLVADTPGLREAVRAEWPLMVPPDDTASLANMLDKLITGEYDLDHLAHDAAEWAENFSVEKMALQYEDAYIDYWKI